MKRALFSISLAFMVLCLAGPLQADSIIVGNVDWYEFAFSLVGVDATNGAGTIPSSGGNSVSAPDAPWTFTNAVPVKLTVTDAFLEGDAFNIYDFGAFVGATSAVANTGNPSGTSDPAVALTIATLSHGVFTLPAGSHSLTIQPYQIVMEGAGFFRTDVVVPVPGAALLFGSGLLGLVGLRRKLLA